MTAAGYAISAVFRFRRGHRPLAPREARRLNPHPTRELILSMLGLLPIFRRLEIRVLLPVRPDNDMTLRSVEHRIRPRGKHRSPMDAVAPWLVHAAAVAVAIARGGA